MIYKKKPSEVAGLWCRADKKFYYLETGVHSIRNPLDRIRNSLTLKGLIVYDVTGTKLHEEPVMKMTLAEAQEKNYEVGVIYLNPHVQQQVEADRENKGLTSNPWKKGE